MAVVNSAAVRLLLAAALFVAAFVASVAIIATGGFRPLGVFAAGAMQALGFAALGLARTARAPARPLRLTVAVTGVVVCSMIYGLLPADSADLQTIAVFLTASALALTAAFVATRHLRLAFWLLVLLAAWFAVAIGRLARAAAGFASPEVAGPSVTLAFLVAMLPFVGCMVAPLHAWAMRGSGEAAGPSFAREPEHSP